MFIRHGLNLLFVIAAITTTPQIARATNGIAVVAVGSQSLSLGGADQATQKDAFSVFANPAALMTIKSSRFDVSNEYSYASRLRHSDGLNQGRETSRPWIPFLSFSGATPVFDGRAVMGVGLAAIGGAGAFFEDLNTGLGTRDRLDGAFGIFRLAHGTAYEMAPGLSLGVSVGMTFARLDQQIFPDTSVTGTQAFFGSKLTGAYAYAPAARFGLTWAATPSTTLGLVYAPKTKLDFKGGELISNQTAAGFGKVQYRAVNSRGMALPDEFGASISQKFGNDVTAHFRTAWLRWSRAIGITTFDASQPTGNAAAATLSDSTRQNWRDQMVVALGIEYAATEKLVYRFGYNYGRNPIPKMAISPLNNSVTEHHLSGGFGYEVAPGTAIDFLLGYLPRADVRYNSPNSPIVRNARLQVEYLAAGIQAGFKW